MNQAIRTNLVTDDGLIVYDLSPRAAELVAVAGRDGVDPQSIDQDYLLPGFRWVDEDEWSRLSTRA